jgi:hypothetical protein
VGAKATFTTGCYTVSDLDYEFAVVGSDWWIKVIHGHDEEYLGFRRLPAHPIFHHHPPRAIQRFLFDLLRRTVVPRSRLPRTLPCATHRAANLAHKSAW